MVAVGFEQFECFDEMRGCSYRRRRCLVVHLAVAVAYQKYRC